MSSKTANLRKFARRLNVENARLTALSADLRQAGFPMIAGDIYDAAFKCGALSFSLNHVADLRRDRRGATARR
jgi:hypothetical protein